MTHAYGGIRARTGLAFDRCEILINRDKAGFRTGLAGIFRPESYPVSISPRIILITGVAGSGKTTIGRRLAAELAWSYYEADDFHSPANKDKMARGIPLDDNDRAPWLASIRAGMDDCLATGRNAVFTCSGLKEKYRRVLMPDIASARVDGRLRISLVYLAGDYGTILARVGSRQGHYMKAEMVQSQFAALEVPAEAISMDIRLPPETIIAEIREKCGV